MLIRSLSGISVLVVLAAVMNKEFNVVRAASPQAYVRRDPGHPQWHHGAFQDVKDSVRSEVRQMLHTRAEVPFQVPLEVNIVLVGFNGDGGYRYSVDSHKLEEFLRVGFPTHRPSCLDTAKPLDIEHHVVYNVFAVNGGP